MQTKYYYKNPEPDFYFKPLAPTDISISFKVDGGYQQSSCEQQMCMFYCLLVLVFCFVRIRTHFSPFIICTSFFL